MVMYAFKDFQIHFEKDSDNTIGISFANTCGIGCDEYTDKYSIVEIRQLLEYIKEIVLKHYRGQTLYFYGFCSKRHRVFGLYFLKMCEGLCEIVEGSLEDGDTFVFNVY